MEERISKNEEMLNNILLSIKNLRTGNDRHEDKDNKSGRIARNN